MALGHYQVTSLLTAGTILQGGFRLGVAASAAGLVGSGGANLGIGNLTGFTENVEMTTTQAGNSNLPVKVIATHGLTITFELLEFYPPRWRTIRGGSADVYAGTASTYINGTPTAHTFSTGGLNDVHGQAFAFQNNTIVGGLTASTVLIVYNAKIEQGMAFTPKSDNDTDPAMVIPFTLTGELETSRTLGDQLYRIETQLGNPAK